MSLTRSQIETIQDQAATGEQHAEGVALTQLVFLAQMALEGDDDAWQALEALHASGELSSQAAPPVCRRPCQSAKEEHSGRSGRYH